MTAPTLLPPDDPQVHAALAHLTADQKEIAADTASRFLADKAVLFRDSPLAVRHAWLSACTEALVGTPPAPAAPPPPPKDGASHQESKPPSEVPVGGAVVTCMADVERRPVEWLWPARIPLGMLTMFDGEPGVGKSTLLIDIAARVTRGLAMPLDTGGGGEPRSVLLLSAEDHPQATLGPRLDEAGADSLRVHTLKIATADADTREPVITAADIAAMERVILDNGVAFVVVDPIVAFLSDGTDTNSDHSVRRSLNLLAGMAERTGCAVVAVRHFRKAGSEKAIHAGGGSIGFTGAARSALVVAHDPEDEGTLVLAVAKSNLAPIAPSLAYQLCERPGQPPKMHIAHVEWVGVSKLLANALTAASATGEERGAMADAKDFLLGALAVGPVPVRDIREGAAARDISPITLKRAKKGLGILAEKKGFAQDGRWTWTLPSIPGARERDDDEESPAQAELAPSFGQRTGGRRP